MRLKQLLIALDQTLNVLLGGWADETLSARAFRCQCGHLRWWYARRAIDTLFFWQRDHCWNSFRSELFRRQLPPAYRVT